MLEREEKRYLSCVTIEDKLASLQFEITFQNRWDLTANRSRVDAHI